MLTAINFRESMDSVDPTEGEKEKGRESKSQKEVRKKTTQTMGANRHKQLHYQKFKLLKNKKKKTLRNRKLSK